MHFNIKNRQLYLLFLIYFLAVIVFPSSHCHAKTGLAEKGHCSKELSIEECLKKTCCELHEEHHDKADEHHIHFILDDQNTSIRLQHPERSVSSMQHTASDEKSSAVEPFFLSYVIPEFFKTACKGFSATFSGLSPPLYSLS